MTSTLNARSDDHSEGITSQTHLEHVIVAEADYDQHEGGVVRQMVVMHYYQGKMLACMTFRNTRFFSLGLQKGGVVPCEGELWMEWRVCDFVRQILVSNLEPTIMTVVAQGETMATLRGWLRSAFRASPFNFCTRVRALQDLGFAKLQGTNALKPNGSAAELKQVTALLFSAALITPPVDKYWGAADMCSWTFEVIREMARLAKGSPSPEVLIAAGY